MHNTVITLICNPAAPLLDNALSTEFSCFLDMQDLGHVRRAVLGDGIASDFLCYGGAGDEKLKTAVADFIGERPIDFAVQSAENRGKKLLIADMDSTIIEQECIDELAALAGKHAEISSITERAMRGELNFEAALQERVAMLKGLPEAALLEAFDKRIRLTPGARTLVQTMNGRGAATALVSGGFTFFTARIAGAAGFKHHQANELLIENGVLTGAVREPILGREAKRSALERLARDHGVDLKDAIAVGDGANDLSMLNLAGLGVAFRAKPAVAKAADAQINHGDLTALLYLQGIPQAEFCD